MFISWQNLRYLKEIFKELKVKDLNKILSLNPSEFQKIKLNI